MQSEVASGTSTMTRKKTATKAVAKKSKSPERKATARPSAKAASAKVVAAKTATKTAPKAAKADAMRKGTVGKKLVVSVATAKKVAKPAPTQPPPAAKVATSPA